VVGRLDHVEVVLDHHHRVAGVDQALQHLEQPADVLEVEPGGGLVEDVEGGPGGAAPQLGRQLDPLGLAPRQCGGGLAEADVGEADVVRVWRMRTILGWFSKKVRASSTDISSTSAMVMPFAR
jgi:hypothetical protein